MYIGMGCVIAPFLPSIWSGIGNLAGELILTGAVFYAAGGVIYAKRRPDPIPHIFGYHEIFHLFVVIAAALQYAAMIHVIRLIGE